MTPPQDDSKASTPSGATPGEMSKMVDEHTACLVFADQIIHIAEQGNEEEVSKCMERLIEYNAEELEPHLQHEEQTVLRTLIHEFPEHTELCVKIGQEHGQLRTIIEELTPASARGDIAIFGHLLKTHTVLEDEQLFPLVAELFSDEQLKAIQRFTPFQPPDPVPFRRKVPHPKPKPKVKPNGQDWFSVLTQYYSQTGKDSASIVLMPHFNPELSRQMAEGLEIDFYDFQTEVMAAHGQAADAIPLTELDEALQARAAQSAFVAHNVEALLCVYPAVVRRVWLRSFLDTLTPNPIVLPISIFQEEVPVDHKNVCDLELFRMPR